MQLSYWKARVLSKVTCNLSQQSWPRIWSKSRDELTLGICGVPSWHHSHIPITLPVFIWMIYSCLYQCTWSVCAQPQGWDSDLWANQHNPSLLNMIASGMSLWPSNVNKSQLRRNTELWLEFLQKWTWSFQLVLEAWRLALLLQTHHLTRQTERKAEVGLGTVWLLITLSQPCSSSAWGILSLCFSLIWVSQVQFPA